MQRELLPRTQIPTRFYFKNIYSSLYTTLYLIPVFNLTENYFSIDGSIGLFNTKTLQDSKPGRLKKWTSSALQANHGPSLQAFKLYTTTYKTHYHIQQAYFCIYHLRFQFVAYYLKSLQILTDLRGDATESLTPKSPK